MKTDERYDIIDKNGKHIGNSTWTNVHKKGLLHRTVHGLVFEDENKNRLLIKKRSKKMHQGPGLLEISVAGHIISGSNPRETIEKEMIEELLSGKTLPNSASIREITTYFNNDQPNNHEMSHLFEIISNGPFFSSDESEDPYWIELEELIIDMKKSPQKYAQYSINAVTEYLKQHSHQK